MPPRPPRPSRLQFLAAIAIALVVGLVQASRTSWTSDDAYISFRYARHLIEGHGLVFNVGERVEGYSNFLWTLLLALGMRFGAKPEDVATVLGIACYTATIGLMAWLAWRRAATALLPVAAVAWASLPDAWVFATSGLETSLFTFLAVAAFAALTTGALRPGRAAAAGFVLALLALTRPDGVLWASVGLVYVVTCGQPRTRTTLACAVVLALVLVPYAGWKLAYYGDLAPNTYHAKSAAMAWWSQGFAYLGFFFQRYWALVAALPLAFIALVRGATDPRATFANSQRREVALAASLALVHLVFVARVGGDFMFARFVIPATPFLLIVIERGIESLAPRRVFVPGIATLVLAASLVFSLSPIPRDGDVRGIVDEHAYYRGPARAAARRMGESLKHFASDLPLRLSFGGAQAVIAYVSDVPLAIESATGLTDRWIARQPLRTRGRVGHEKPAPWSYLIEDRRAHMVPGHSRALDDTLSAYVPPITIGLDGEAFTLLTWDPPLMQRLIERGAKVPDFSGMVDEFIGTIDALPDSVVRAEYGRLERFYFAGWNDPVREGALRARLGLPVRDR